MPQPLAIVVLGLSITSSWGNGHATTYRALLRALAERGHRITFLERDRPWYAAARDLPAPLFCQLGLYESLDELRDRYTTEVAAADLVLVGSYVADGVAIGDWVLATATGVTAFYDIDTPVTLAKLAREDYEYLHPKLIPQYDLYLSFTGGPTLERLERSYGSPAARALYCAADPTLYQPDGGPLDYDLGYLGTYSDDRQPGLEQLLLEPARQYPPGRFCVGGAQYPASIRWPANVAHREHVPPAEHARFYSSQRYTLNLTRADMKAAGYSPSVRLFEAAACATPVISDNWPGLAQLFVPGQEILLADRPETVLDYLTRLSEEERQALGQRAQARVRAEHTAAHRAESLENYIAEVSRHRLNRMTDRISQEVVHESSAENDRS